jgi:hypothetical protein
VEVDGICVVMGYCVQWWDFVMGYCVVIGRNLL